jgi:hypothetical protein
MKTRRGPWLSGLIFALIGAVWMIGQVVGGVVSLITDALSAGLPAPATATVSAPPVPGATELLQFASTATVLNQ